MAGFAKMMTDDEIKAAAKYFSSIPAKPWIKVVETETAPKTGRGGIFIALEGDGGRHRAARPAHHRDAGQTRGHRVRRNPRSGFIAYVPPGSIKKGEALVTTGDGKVTACTACHGPTCAGSAGAALAGRSPSYLARQLYDMQHGNRPGLDAADGAGRRQSRPR